MGRINGGWEGFLGSEFCASEYSHSEKRKLCAGAEISTHSTEPITTKRRSWSSRFWSDLREGSAQPWIFV